MTLPSLPAFASDEARRRAVLDRDSAADGAFWYAVRTTGVYCRPSCPSRRPRPENVAYFDDPVTAEAAGYRPCLRCRPAEVSHGQRAIARARHLLETAVPIPTLADLGRAVGVSPFHLQRAFKRAVGLSPKQYALQVRAEKLKAGLKEGFSVTTAMYDAGHESSRTLYDRATDGLGMTPGAYRRGGAGETLAYALSDSPLGRMLVAATGRGLAAVRFGEDEALVLELRGEYPEATLVGDGERLRPQVEVILAHLAGREPRLDLATDAEPTDFQRRVWDVLRSIPYGETRSYAQVAEMIGDPKAVRAVARACATNPLALVVPCHRSYARAGA
jgi:AraC family transcriptional regulator of adaptative response/methylated-DNA-[protein]-cysteine methyltransferase